METFQIAYEITGDDYAEAMKLLRRRVKASGMVRWGMPGIGLAVLLLPFINYALVGDFDKFLVGLSFFGAFLFFCGITQHLTRWNSRTFYKRMSMAGQKYTASFSQEGILIESTDTQWRFKWAVFDVKDESEKMLMLYKSPLMYVYFAKHYFTEEQFNSLREFLSTLPPPAARPV